MVFYFGLLLPLVFAAASLAITKKEQLLVSLISSFSILLLFYMGLLLNRTVGILSFLDFESVEYFSGLESPAGVAIIMIFLVVSLLLTIFFKKDVSKTISPLTLAASYISIFFITALVSSNNLMVFLFACESLIWFNLFQFESKVENRKFLYFLTAIATSLLLILTIFLGLLESIFLSEMTYNLENLSKISLSYVSGTIYSTQTLFYMIAGAYVVLRISFLIKMISLIVFSEKIRTLGSFIVAISIPVTLLCFILNQSTFYSLVCEEYGSYAVFISVISIAVISFFSFKNLNSSWSS